MFYLRRVRNTRQRHRRINAVQSMMNALISHSLTLEEKLYMFKCVTKKFLRVHPSWVKSLYLWMNFKWAMPSRIGTLSPPNFSVLFFLINLLRNVSHFFGVNACPLLLNYFICEINYRIILIYLKLINYFGPHGLRPT